LSADVCGGLVRRLVWRACPPVLLADITMRLFYKQSCALQLQIILAPQGRTTTRHRYKAPQGGATTNLINQTTAGPINW